MYVFWCNMCVTCKITYINTIILHCIHLNQSKTLITLGFNHEKFKKISIFPEHKSEKLVKSQHCKRGGGGNFSSYLLPVEKFCELGCFRPPRKGPWQVSEGCHTLKKVFFHHKVPYPKHS